MEIESSISKLSKSVFKRSKDMIDIKNKITQMEYDLFALKENYKSLKLKKENSKDELLKLLMEDKKEVTKSE